jgi:hypothetical protein
MDNQIHLLAHDSFWSWNYCASPRVGYIRLCGVLMVINANVCSHKPGGGISNFCMSK